MQFQQQQQQPFLNGGAVYGQAAVPKRVFLPPGMQIAAGYNGAAIERWTATGQAVRMTTRNYVGGILILALFEAMVLIAVITTWVYNVENKDIRDDFLFWTLFHIPVVVNIILALFIRYRWNTWAKSALPGPGGTTLWVYFTFELLAAVGGAIIFIVFIVMRVDCMKPEPCSTTDHEIISTYLIIVAGVAIVLGIIGAILAQFVRRNLLRLQSDPSLAIKATAAPGMEFMAPPSGYGPQTPPLGMGMLPAQANNIPMVMMPPAMNNMQTTAAPIVTYGSKSASLVPRDNPARIRVEDSAKVSVKYE